MESGKGRVLGICVWGAVIETAFGTGRRVEMGVECDPDNSTSSQFDDVVQYNAWLHDVVGSPSTGVVGCKTVGVRPRIAGCYGGTTSTTSVRWRTAAV